MNVIATPESHEHFQMARLIAALRIQARTGMTLSRGSVIAYVREHYGVKGRTAAKAGAELEALYERTYGRKYGS